MHQNSIIVMMPILMMIVKRMIMWRRKKKRKRRSQRKRIIKPKSKAPAKATPRTAVVDDRTAALEAQMKQLNDTLNGKHIVIPTLDRLSSFHVSHTPPLL